MWGLVERSVEWSVEDVERQLGCSREAVLGVLPLELYRVRGVVGIRDFTVYNAEDGKVISSDPYSTHAFDWFFPNGICEATMRQLSWIEEIPYEKAKMRSVDQVVRKNVSQYDVQNKKIPETQCQKKWQFVRIEE